MKKLTSKSGFTLVELMVVIVIVGILAAVAIPKFTIASYKAKVSEFPTILTQIYTAEGAQHAETGAYIDHEDLTGLTLPTSRYFVYSTVLAGGGFTSQAAVGATAIGDALTGQAATITETGAKAFAVGSVALASYCPTWAPNPGEAPEDPEVPEGD
jgi:prepilin-type N-terminal cleavage/methylation domain-containing protein